MTMDLKQRSTIRETWWNSRLRAPKGEVVIVSERDADRRGEREAPAPPVQEDAWRSRGRLSISPLSPSRDLALGRRRGRFPEGDRGGNEDPRSLLGPLLPPARDARTFVLARGDDHLKVASLEFP